MPGYKPLRTQEVWNRQGQTYRHGLCALAAFSIAWACAGLLVVGIGLSLLLPLGDFSIGPLVVTVLLGAGLSLLLLLWLEVMAYQEPRIACIVLPAAFLIGNVLTVFLSTWFTGEQNFLVGVLVVAGSLVALLVCFRSSGRVPVKSSSLEADKLPNLRKTIRPAFLGIAVFAFVYGIENELLVHFGSGSEVMSVTSLKSYSLYLKKESRRSTNAVGVPARLASLLCT